MKPTLDETPLIAAEAELTMFASLLAGAGRDTDAADALRAASALLHYRCGLSESEKKRS